MASFVDDDMAGVGVPLGQPILAGDGDDVVGATPECEDRDALPLQFAMVGFAGGGQYAAQDERTERRKPR